MYEVIFSPNIWTKYCKDFFPVLCHTSTGQKSLQFLVYILGETMTSWIYSEIYWPLVDMSFIWIIRLRCTLIFSIALIYSAKPMLHSFVKYAGWHDKLANFATIKAHRDVGVRWVGWVFSNPVFGGLKLCEIDRQSQISYIPIMIAHLKNYCFLRP